MKFSYNWLKDCLGGKAPRAKKTAELLTLHSFEVEEVKKIGSDFAFNIDILPNRGPDCFSHVGIAREIAAITGKKLKFSTVKLKEDKKTKAQDMVSLEVKNKQDCPRYTLGVFTGVKVAPSPKWMQKRLKICGLRPINNIVDIANYVMLETGQPLHAFDGEKIVSQKIIVRRAKRKEKITTLDKENYTLDKNILVIADPRGPLGIAGIKGGKRAEIDKKTKIIVLESANFYPKVIRQGSKKINLQTDASWRFEHGIDLNLTKTAILRTGELIQKLASGKMAQGLIDFYPHKVKAKKIKLDLDYLENLLGIKVSLKETKKILKSLEFKIIETKSKFITVEVPSFRLDVSFPEDLIEEVGRMKGLQEVPSHFPLVSLIPPKGNFDIFWENLTKDILKEAGFSEVYNSSFVNKKNLQSLGYKISESIEVANPTSLDYQYLRPSLIPNLMRNIKENQKNFREIKIFELGKTFKLVSSKRKRPKYKENRMLTGLMTGDTFFQLKGRVELLFDKLGITNVWFDNYQATPETSTISIWHPKACAEIKIDNEEIGFLGKISSSLLKNLKIRGELVVFDLDFDKISRLASEEHEYAPISSYPAAVRDISLLVPRKIQVAEVLNKINIAGGSLLIDVDLFDVYEGKELPEGKKNLSFHLIYQAKDRTLSSKSIDKLQEKIIKALEKNLEWQARV